MSDALQTPRDRFCYCVFISIVKLPLFLGEMVLRKLCPCSWGMKITSTVSCKSYFARLSESDEREGAGALLGKELWSFWSNTDHLSAFPSATMRHTHFQYCVIIATSHCSWDKKGIVIKHMIGSRHFNHALYLCCRAGLPSLQQSPGIALGWQFAC